MSREISRLEWSTAISQHGVFGALFRFQESGAVSPEFASQMLMAFFTKYENQVKEAARELEHIQSVLGRLAVVCRRGATTRRKLQRDDAIIRELAHEAVTFDNWVISLYETDLTILGLARPDIAKKRPHEFARSMDALWQKRLDEQVGNLKDPTLFRR
jgi:hypothetical protein